MWIKTEPNQHELDLFARAVKYTHLLSKIPGIEMIAVVNSLSMYATHEDSDIDLFIITKPGMIYFVRFFSTLILSVCGVWRKGEDITGNFCLSFFITTEAMNLEKIAIEDDIYLRNWIYYMKPLFVQNTTYDKFIAANNWVNIDAEQEKENQKYKIALSMEKWWRTGKLYLICNRIIRYFLLPRTERSYAKLWQPEWVIISDSMLKFHDKDRRSEIRDTIKKKNFDK